MDMELERAQSTENYITLSAHGNQKSGKSTLLTLISTALHSCGYHTFAGPDEHSIRLRRKVVPKNTNGSGEIDNTAAQFASLSGHLDNGQIKATAAMSQKSTSNSQEKRVLDSDGGMKYDSDKPDMSLLSSVAMEELAKVLTFGKQKYAAHNWRKGISTSRLVGAALRHTFAFLKGETYDPETGLHHMAHAMCCCMFILELHVTHKHLDDRFVVKVVPASVGVVS